MTDITITGRAEMGRQFISDGDLAMKVAQVVSTFITSGQEFTAFSVTTALRKLLPTTEIAHTRVSPIVREGMRRTVVMQTGNWEKVDGVMFSGANGPARLYRPHSAPATPLPAVEPQPKMPKQLSDLNAPSPFEPL